MKKWWEAEFLSWVEGASESELENEGFSEWDVEHMSFEEYERRAEEVVRFIREG